MFRVAALILLASQALAAEPAETKLLERLRGDRLEAIEAAERLAALQSAAALAALLENGDRGLLSSYARALRGPLAPGIERQIVEHFDAPKLQGILSELIDDDSPYASQALLDLLWTRITKPDGKPHRGGAARRSSCRR